MFYGAGNRPQRSLKGEVDGKSGVKASAMALYLFSGVQVLY
jgi:hypothetical protein